MYASATIGHTTREIRSTRHLTLDGERRTIRVRPGRSTARRAAINASGGYR
ncbi:hypothetical protein [Micromonospora sp. NPDC049891]|uniref:hypothetical protein n=1 Tax=Micromonospora sp. NPDC049891 TaxID=3155655 RepID=UPI00340313EE